MCVQKHAWISYACGKEKTSTICACKCWKLSLISCNTQISDSWLPQQHMCSLQTLPTLLPLSRTQHSYRFYAQGP